MNFAPSQRASNFSMAAPLLATQARTARARTTMHAGSLGQVQACLALTIHWLCEFRRTSTVDLTQN